MTNSVQETNVNGKLHKAWSFIVFLSVFMRDTLEKMGVKFAPWDVPWERRFQTIAAAGWIYTLLFGEILAVIFTIYIMRTSFYWIAVAYVIMIASQRDSCTYGLKRWTWVRRWRWWFNLQKFFPIELKKTDDCKLDSEKNYLFCVFPHGVLSTGCFVNFATDATGFDELFPNMKSLMVTLQGHFLVPFFRELVMWLGLCASSHDSLNYVLDTKNGKGNCAALVVGGAAESLNCHNGQYRVILRKRKGFIKMAMKHGAPLVPVFSFGETELYEQVKNPEGSIVRSLQEWFRQTTGIAPVIPLGRGLFQYTIGVLPQRNRVVTVVGAPIPVPKTGDPSEEEVNIYHNKFIQSLENLFNTEKDKYLSHIENVSLVIE